MEITHVNISDVRGGAGRFALALHHGLKRKGFSSVFLVDRKYSNEQDVLKLENDKYRSLWFKLFNRLSIVFLNGHFFGSWFLFKIFRFIGHPGKVIFNYLGIDYFNYKGLERKLSNLRDHRKAIIQVYVTHGNYLSLKYLQVLSLKSLVVLRMPDAWLLSGHCAHSFDCERWKIGCGKCPDLTIPPEINRDSTAYNWKVKKSIFIKSKFHIVTPSQWLLQRVEQSMLARGAASLQVIPNGVDTSIFSPRNRFEEKQRLGLGSFSFIVLFSANGIKKNRWKDFEAFKIAFDTIGKMKMAGEQILFLALGETGTDIKNESVTMRFVPYVTDRELLASYYGSADIYLHASKVDTFPNSTLEAIACGLPVIASSTGGIPEQIKGLAKEVCEISNPHNRYGMNEATGILVETGDSHSFSKAILFLMKHPESRVTMGRNARQDCLTRFSLERVIADYLDLYTRLIKASSNE